MRRRRGSGIAQGAFDVDGGDPSWVQIYWRKIYFKSVCHISAI